MAQKPSGTELLKQQTGVSPIPAKDSGKQTFASALEAMKPEFAKVLPKSITADRLIRIALTEVRKNPTLAQCDLQSTIGSIMVGAQLALEPGVMGQAYLVPFNQSYKDQGQYQTAGIITKEIGGVAKEHKFIRADRHASYEDAVEFSLGKARQIVDQQGDRMFG